MPTLTSMVWLSQLMGDAGESELLEIGLTLVSKCLENNNLLVMADNFDA